jgi:hypothetical protein
MTRCAKIGGIDRESHRNSVRDDQYHPSFSLWNDVANEARLVVPCVSDVPYAVAQYEFFCSNRFLVVPIIKCSVLSPGWPPSRSRSHCSAGVSSIQTLITGTRLERMRRKATEFSPQ